MTTVSLVMSSFLRADLLEMSLLSIIKNKPQFTLEIVVINDGVGDETENVCKKYSDFLDIKYFFSGSRNVEGVRRRSPAFANNIAVKKSSGDICVLSCPEIYHLNGCLDMVVAPLLNNTKYLTIPEFMYFDDTGEFTLSIKTACYTADMLNLLSIGVVGREAVQMPFFMGLWKKEFLDIGGYDEDFIGYAGDDNDLVSRLRLNGCKYCRTSAKIVHLYHGKRCDSQEHWENPDWVYNKKLYDARRGQIIRNINREWGKL